ncbi:CLUMA_CG009646, isoform A [Clunio marinus]|uniref:CLUMA_CG009646, isoform A n=1 Tax=Clunio marinus TaxID=568069 RepID=A0A1J1I7Q2_9DIPT|nr:CLUMA_CG009646, isoform A [Clunio marinus]
MTLGDLLSKPAVQIAAAVILPNAGGWVNGVITKKNIKSWYEGLKHPSFRPPNWLFGPVWTALYSGMGYASYVVWKQGGGFGGQAKFPLMLYGAQLALNWAWSPIFFHYHELKWSTVEIGALTATAAATGIAFYNIEKVAGLIFVPYLAWLSFASLLNYSIYRLNTPAIEDKKPEEKKK